MWHASVPSRSARRAAQEPASTPLLPVKRAASYTDQICITPGVVLKVAAERMNRRNDSTQNASRQYFLASSTAVVFCLLLPSCLPTELTSLGSAAVRYIRKRPHLAARSPTWFARRGPYSLASSALSCKACGGLRGRTRCQCRSYSICSWLCCFSLWRAVARSWPDRSTTSGMCRGSWRRDPLWLPWKSSGR